MVKMKNKRNIYIVVAVLGLCAIVIASTVSHMQYERYAPRYSQEQISNLTQISAEELRAFLNTWIKYCEEYEHCPQLPELSLDTTDGQKQADADLSQWLTKHGWDVNRFLYIESRLNVIIATIQRDKEILKKQQLMEDGVQHADNSEIAETLRQAVDLQKKKLNVEKISPNERYIVESQLDELVKLLKGEYN